MPFVPNLALNVFEIVTVVFLYIGKICSDTPLSSSFPMMVNSLSLKKIVEKLLRLLKSIQESKDRTLDMLKSHKQPGRVLKKGCS